METVHGDASLKRVRPYLKRLKHRYRPEVLFLYSVSAAARNEANAASGYALIEADEANLAKLRAAYPRQVKQRTYGILRDRVALPNEDCWIIAGPDGTLCGFCCMAFKTTMNARINHRVALSPTQAYLFDTYVAKQHRGKGLHAFTIAKRLEIAADRGVTEGLTTIARTNRASIASFKKFGAKVKFVLVYVPVLKRTFQLPARGK